MPALAAPGEALAAEQSADERSFPLDPFLRLPLDPMCVIRADGRVAWLNPAMARALGASIEDVRGQPFAALVHADDRGQASAALGEVAAGARVIDFEARVGDQSFLWKAAALEGGPAYVTGREITDRKRKEAALRESEARLRALLDGAVDGIITIDAGGLIESFNPAAEKIFGWTSGEVIGRNVSVLMPEPHQSAHDGYLRAYLETGVRRIVGIGREVLALRKDGRVVPIDLSVAEVQTHGRRTFLGIVRDLTERKREGMMSAELARDAHLQGRIEMAAGILHDVGNALTGIGARAVDVQGAVKQVNSVEEMVSRTAEFLRANGRALDAALGPAKAAALVELMTAIASAQANALAGAQESLSKLFAFLSHAQDLLTLQRSGSGAGSGPRRERVSLRKILFDANVMMSDAVAKRGGVLTLRCDEPAPDVVVERGKLMPALMNLLKNAVESFDGAGLGRAPEITLAAGRRGGGAYIEVRDNGPGFAPGAAEIWFQEGYSTKSRGSGLGLGASRRAVRSLGGEISLASEGPGKGCLARIDLPEEVVA